MAIQIHVFHYLWYSDLFILSLLIKKINKSTDSQVDLSGHGKFQEEMLFQEFYLQSMANFSGHVSIFHMLPKRQVPESSITNQKDTTFRSPFCKQFCPSISGERKLYQYDFCVENMKN